MQPPAKSGSIYNLSKNKVFHFLRNRLSGSKLDKIPLRMNLNLLVAQISDLALWRNDGL